MSAKPKRPSVMDLDSLLVSKPVAAAPETAVGVDEADSEATAPVAARRPRPAKVEDSMFRTSMYFSRLVHDKLRAIAFEERKTITDLINEGVDHVLQSRNYPTAAKLRGKTR